MFGKSAVAAAVCLMVVSGFAQMPIIFPCGADVVCTLNGGTLAVVGAGVMTDYHGCPQCNVVDNVAPWYGEYRDVITSVVIESGVTHIGNYAFWDLPQLASITIPFTYTDQITIGYSAFADCESLTSIMIPGSVTSIGSMAFANCENLAYVDFPHTSYPIPIDTTTARGTFLNISTDAVLMTNMNCIVSNNSSESRDGPFARAWGKFFATIHECGDYSSVFNRSALLPRTSARVSVRNGALHIRDLSSSSETRVRLIDMRGKFVTQFNVGAHVQQRPTGARTPGRPLSFSLVGIPAGRYFVEMRDGVRVERASVVVGGW